MNKTIASIVATVIAKASEWHQAHKEIFDLDEPLSNTVEYYTTKLLHHNYLIWHYIDLYKSPDSGTVLFVYDKGIEHNRYRNETIEQLDALLCSQQKGTGKVNTETIGSAIDRMSIHYIKYLHLLDGQDERYTIVKNQFDILANCISELMDDMISGERQCMIFSRFKIDYSEK